MKLVPLILSLISFTRPIAKSKSDITVSSNLVLSKLRLAILKVDNSDKLLYLILKTISTSIIKKY